MKTEYTFHLPLHGLQGILQEQQPMEKQGCEKQAIMLGPKAQSRCLTPSGPQSSVMPLTSCATLDKYSTSLCLSVVVCQMGITMVSTQWGYCLCQMHSYATRSKYQLLLSS